MQMDSLFPHVNFRREVTIGHLLLDVDAPTGVLAKVNPPIRPREDVEYLWERLLAGDIHWVCSDHACCEAEEKVDAAAREEVSVLNMNDAVLNDDVLSLFRGAAARANYLAADRPDIQLAAKEICRWMSSPTVHGVVAMKRLGRYLEQRPRFVYKYPWQSVTHVMFIATQIGQAVSGRVSPLAVVSSS